MAISLKRGEPEPPILNGSTPQADHPLFVGPLFIEIWASIFCYLQKKYR